MSRHSEEEREGWGDGGLCVQVTHLVGGIRQVAQEDPCAGDGPGH